MAWENSNRSSRLPVDWPIVRRRILKRDNYRCMVRKVNGRLCGDFASEVDHIKPGDNHSELNLQAICHECHKVKSSGEGAQALAGKRRRIKQSFRRSEDHPGLL